MKLFTEPAESTYHVTHRQRRSTFDRATFSRTLCCLPAGARDARVFRTTVSVVAKVHQHTNDADPVWEEARTFRNLFHRSACHELERENDNKKKNKTKQKIDNHNIYSLCDFGSEKLVNPARLAGGALLNFPHKQYVPYKTYIHYVRTYNSLIFRESVFSDLCAYYVVQYERALCARHEINFPREGEGVSFSC